MNEAVEIVSQIKPDRIDFIRTISKESKGYVKLYKKRHNEFFSDIFALTQTMIFSQSGELYDVRGISRERAFTVYHTAFNTAKEDENMLLPICQLTDAHGSLKGIVNKARVSYYPPGHPKATRGETTNVDRKLLKRLLDENHGCYDARTEVLTNNGWKFWPDVDTKKDAVASYDPATKKVSFVAPKRWIKKDATKLMRFNTDRIDLLVTRDHKMVGYQNGEYVTVNAKDMVDNRFGFILAPENGYASDKAEENYDDHVIAMSYLMGAAAIYGHLAEDDSRIVLKLKTMAECQSILDVMSNDPLMGSIRWYPNTLEIKIDRNLSHELIPSLFDNDGNKCLSREIATMSPECVDAFLHGASGMKVYSHRNSHIFKCDNKNIADTIQMTLFLRGCPTRLGTLKGEPVVISYGADISTNYFVLDDIEAGSTGRNATGLPTLYAEEDDYKGKVYCATVETGALVVRRNGKVVICGNSPFEHNLLSFRIVTPNPIFKQQLRHRPGWAYSEGSTRYTDFSERIYVPVRLFKQSTISHQGSAFELIENHDESRENMLNSAIEINKYYGMLINSIGLAKESARFIMPFGNFTYGYVTCNLRALFNFLGTRVENHAQFEMRQHALAMALCAYHAFPDVFKILLDPNTGLLEEQVREDIIDVTTHDIGLDEQLNEVGFIGHEAWEKESKRTNIAVRLA